MSHKHRIHPGSGFSGILATLAFTLIVSWLAPAKTALAGSVSFEPPNQAAPSGNTLGVNAEDLIGDTCDLPSENFLRGSISVDVSFSPPTQTVLLGDSFTVDIIADIPDPVVGFGMDFAISDGTVLSQIGGPLIASLPWVSAFAPDGDGLAALAFPGSISGTGIVLATITLSADTIASSDLLLSVTAGDLTEGFPLDPTGFAPVIFQPGNVVIISEPASLALLGLGGL